jgi:ATP-dependent Clp protease ATP-binding subunit ClpA
MLERFEPAARRAIVDARNEAGAAGQDRIRCEHVLLGLFAASGTAADAMTAAGLTLTDLRSRVPRGTYPPVILDADALASLGIDLDSVRRATDAAFGPGALDRVRVPGRRRLVFADEAKRTLEDAVRHAQQHGQREISSGHMLVAIIDQPRSSGYALLTDAGVDIPALRADVLRRITPAP